MDGGTPSVADETRSVLLVLRLRAFGEVPAIQSALDAFGLPVADVATLVSRLDLAGLVEHRDGSAAGWRLTADGREEGERLLRVELDELDDRGGLGGRAAIQGAYERFLGLNGPLLHVCTDWQLKGGAAVPEPVVNDHTDDAYDAAVVGRLEEIHRRLTTVCTTLAHTLERFTAYGPRFDAAVARIHAGDRDAIDQPGTDSYHSVWFELHEHLVATLGVDRTSEPLPSPDLPPA